MSMNVLAEGDVIYFKDKGASSEELINAFTKGNKTENLDADKGNPPGEVRYRGITLKRQKKEEPAPSVQMSGDACMAGKHSVAVNIRFASNSSKVKQKDTAFMKQIADAMNSPQLVNCFFVVEGHTDSIGEEPYNLWLSQARANAVKTHLARHNVNSERLIVVGKGESELINTQNPQAAENRRVQFKVINPTK